MKDGGRILFWTFWGEEWEALSDMKGRASYLIIIKIWKSWYDGNLGIRFPYHQVHVWPLKGGGRLGR